MAKDKKTRFELAAEQAGAPTTEAELDDALKRLLEHPPEPPKPPKKAPKGK